MEVKIMSTYRTILNSGKWFKGNTHAHTTLSDGCLTPEQLTQKYKAEDYSFMAITDHWLYGKHQELQNDKFLIFGGVEFDVAVAPNDNRTYHLVAIGDPNVSLFPHGYTFPHFGKNTEISTLINYLNESNHICISAHPYWSKIQMEEFDKVEGCLAVEIYNHDIQYEFNCGLSEPYFSRWFWKGKHKLSIACDDTHFSEALFGGSIYVKADTLSHKCILDSIKAGSYYCSNGPKIYDFYIEDNTAVILTSPCYQISIHTAESQGESIISNNNNLTSATFNIPSNCSGAYIICNDVFGRKAWTQPIWIL